MGLASGGGDGVVCVFCAGLCRVWGVSCGGGGVDGGEGGCARGVWGGRVFVGVCGFLWGGRGYGGVGVDTYLGRMRGGELFRRKQVAVISVGVTLLIMGGCI